MNNKIVLRIGVVGLYLSLGCCTAHSQQGNLLSDLKSGDWEQRANAFEKIKASQASLLNPEMKKALVDTLDQENQLIHETLKESNGRVGVGVKYGESYDAYYEELLDTVENTADWNDSHQVCVLANSSYDPLSQFAAKVIAKGGTTVARCLLKIEESKNELDREQTIPVLVHLAAVTVDLPPAIREQIRKAVLDGLQDPDAGVRIITVEAVGKYGTVDVIPILQAIAQSDPYSRPINEGRDHRFDIRELATKAIQSIQQRGKTQ